MSARVRVDALLVERGLAESRERAQRLIRAGLVYTSNERLEKPGRMVDREIELNVRGSDCPYVSRGGLKLEGALKLFGHDPAGEVALDLGASTGGFTDCLLQRGAVRVYAIDVGRGQLHERLLRDPRVISRERTHVDSLEAEDFDPRPTLAVVDLSFISLRRAYPVLRRVLLPGGACGGAAEATVRGGAGQTAPWRRGGGRGVAPAGLAGPVPWCAPGGPSRAGPR